MYKISGTTSMYCLLGSPVSHSISPMMHNLAFDSLDIDAKYLAFEVTEENLKDAIYGLRTIGCKGFNLTMPLKQSILPFLDELSDAARLTGSVNTVDFKNDKLIGHNTDGIGFVRAIDEAGFNVVDKDIVLLGAGGAAKAIITQLALDRAKSIHVFKRKNDTFETFKSFVDSISDFSGVPIELCDFGDINLLKKIISKSDIIVNATNIGMGDDKSSPIPKDLIRSDIFVADIIYHPKETTLLSYAKEIGASYTNGQGMLLYQGAAAFEIWTGKKMPVDIVKKEVLN